MLVDDVAIIETHDTEYNHGVAGLMTAGEGNARHTAMFDNLLINHVNGSAVAPTEFDKTITPIYRP